MRARANRLVRIQLLYGDGNKVRPNLLRELLDAFKRALPGGALIVLRRFSVVVEPGHAHFVRYSRALEWKERRRLCRIAREVLQSDEPIPGDFFVR